MISLKYKFDNSTHLVSSTINFYLRKVGNAGSAFLRWARRERSLAIAHLEWCWGELFIAHLPLVKQYCKIMKSSPRALLEHPRRAFPANLKRQSLGMIFLIWLSTCLLMYFLSESHSCPRHQQWWHTKHVETYEETSYWGVERRKWTAETRRGGASSWTAPSRTGEDMFVFCLVI